MGLFSLFIGGGSKPRVTDKEFLKVLADLRSKGMSHQQLNRLREILAGDMQDQNPTRNHPHGLEESEINARMKWMRENKHIDGFSDHQINEIEESLKKRL